MKVLTGFVSILFNYLLQTYLERFESLNCICGFDIRRDISKTFLLMSYVIIIGKVLVPKIPMSARYFLLLFTLIFDFVFISYIFSLKQKNCSCKNISQDAITSVLYYYYMLLVFLFVLSITLIFMVIPLNLFIMKK